VLSVMCLGNNLNEMIFAMLVHFRTARVKLEYNAYRSNVKEEKCYIMVGATSSDEISSFVSFSGWV